MQPLVWGERKSARTPQIPHTLTLTHTHSHSHNVQTLVIGAMLTGASAFQLSSRPTRLGPGAHTQRLAPGLAVSGLGSRPRSMMPLSRGKWGVAQRRDRWETTAVKGWAGAGLTSAVIFPEVAVKNAIMPIILVVVLCLLAAIPLGPSLTQQPPELIGSAGVCVCAHVQCPR